MNSADIFGMDESPAELVKTWSKEELDALKDSIKDDYKTFLKAQDFWSALQLDAWVKSLNLDIKFSTPLGQAYIGNPIYAFPFDVRHYFDHGAWVAVASEERYHFINGEGRPVFPSVSMPFYVGQCAITSDRKFAAAMNIRESGDDVNPLFHYRVAIKNIETDTLTLNTSWIEVGEPVDRHYDSESVMAQDGSAVALHFRARNRQHDFVIVSLPSKQAFRINDIRNIQGLGKNGDWAIGRQPRGNQLLLIQGEKRTPLHAAESQSGYAAVIHQDGKTIEFIDRNNKTTALPIDTSLASTVWAMDKWLIVRLGKVTEKLPDEKDLFGVVTKAGAEISVFKSLCYRWKDLEAGNTTPAKEIIGEINLNGQRYDSLLTYTNNIITSYDCGGDEIIGTEFAKIDSPIQSLEIRDNGIRVETSDSKNIMLNYHGKPIWSGGAGYIRMIHPMVMLYEQSMPAEKKTPAYTKQQLVLFSDTGGQHTIDLPTPKNGNAYTVDAQHYLHFGRLYHNDRNWLYFNLSNGGIILDGHVNPDAEIVRQWGLPTWSQYGRGRFNRFLGRLIPKWVYHKQPSEDTFNPRDAMYARGGLMVITEEDKLYRYNDDLNLTDAIEDIELSYGRFAVQAKDINTYITCWINNSHLAKFYYDKSGKLRTAKDPVPVDNQRPEGEWQIDGRNLYIPRQGPTRWPDEKAGFSPWRMRSRDGVSSLLVISRSLILQIDANTVKKLFAR